MVGTLAAAIAGGFLTNSAFDARYASVVFIPLILLVAVGLITFRDRRIRSIILAVAVVAGLAGSIPNVTTNRTQAGQVADAIARTGHAGDMVAYCPDQLGPAVTACCRRVATSRHLPPGHGPGIRQLGRLRGRIGGRRSLGVRRASPVPGRRLPRQIYLVWAPGYQTFGVKCEGIVQTLQASSHYRAQALVSANPVSFYQPMSLVQFTPTS